MKKVALLAGLSFLLLSSCATKPDRFIEVDESLYAGNFDAAIDAIRKGQEAKPPLYPESNSASLFLDKGMLEHYTGNHAQASQDLQEAERLIAEAYTKSISQDVASYIANDNTKDYAGEDFEDIYINVFNALNYYKQGSSEGAMVEIRKLILPSGKLDMLARKYGDDSKKTGAADWLMGQLRQRGITLDDALPQGEPFAFSNSALAQYLGGLFYLADGNDDSARIAFNAVEQAYASNPVIYYHPAPRAIAEAQSVPDGKARLNVVAFAGLGPIKKEADFAQSWPFMQNNAFKNPVFKLPVFDERDSGEHHVTVTVNGENFDLELIEDMGVVAKETYKAKFASVFFKTYIRVLTKYIAADIAATEGGSRLGALAGGALGAADLGASVGQTAAAIAARAAIDATEKADVRMGRFLPNKAFVGGINLDPGIYNVAIAYSSGFRKEVEIEVKAGGINLVDAVSLTRANDFREHSVVASGAASSGAASSSTAGSGAASSGAAGSGAASSGAAGSSAAGSGAASSGANDAPPQAAAAQAPANKPQTSKPPASKSQAAASDWDGSRFALGVQSGAMIGILNNTGSYSSLNIGFAFNHLIGLQTGMGLSFNNGWSSDIGSSKSSQDVSAPGYGGYPSYGYDQPASVFTVLDFPLLLTFMDRRKNIYVRGSVGGVLSVVASDLELTYEDYFTKYTVKEKAEEFNRISFSFFGSVGLAFKLGKGNIIFDAGVLASPGFDYSYYENSQLTSDSIPRIGIPILLGYEFWL